MCVLVFWMIAELALLSRADLSFVLPVTASAYVLITASACVLIAMCGHFVLDEQISRMQWIGIVVISLGAALVGGTPASTTQHPAEDGL